MARTIKCPICQRKVALSDPNMPFCSDRCRTLDLANWATEKYSMPSDIHSEELESLEEHSTSEFEGPIQ